MERQDVSLSELNNANFNLMQQHMPDALDGHKAMANLIRQKYLELGDPRFVSKTEKEQWEFALMMTDKTFALNKLYKTKEGKDFIDIVSQNKKYTALLRLAVLSVLQRDRKSVV